MSKEIVDKLTVKQLKDQIKMYKKESNYGKMKKNELVEHLTHLQGHGKLKKQKGAEGAGIMDIFKAPKQEFNNVSKKTLKTYGQYNISKLQLIRTPIMNVLDKALNLLTIGKWESEKKNYSFDNLFHLGLIATVDSKNGPKMIILEKNEVVNISPNVSIKSDSELMDVPLKRPMTLQGFVDYAMERTTKDKFFLYDGVKNNCQDFILLLLKNNGLNTMKTQKFIKQHVEELMKKMPSFLQPVMNVATDLGARVNSVVGGAEITNEERQAIRSKFNQGKKDNAKEFWEKNEALKKQLTNKSNFDNREYIADRKEKKRKASIKGERYMNHVKGVGWDPNSGESVADFLDNYLKKTGFALVEDGDYDYKWIQTKVSRNLVNSIDDLGIVGKILKTAGLEKVTMGVSDVLNNVAHLGDKPSLKNIAKLGKSVVETGKSLAEAGKDGPQGIVKTTAKNVAKEAVSAVKKKTGGMMSRTVSASATDGAVLADHGSHLSAGDGVTDIHRTSFVNIARHELNFRDKPYWMAPENLPKFIRVCDGYLQALVSIHPEMRVEFGDLPIRSTVPIPLRVMKRMMEDHTMIQLFTEFLKEGRKLP
jgi:hypothetical protein